MSSSGDSAALVSTADVVSLSDADVAYVTALQTNVATDVCGMRALVADQLDCVVERLYRHLLVRTIAE